jgi:hypothetical protein
MPWRVPEELVYLSYTQTSFNREQREQAGVLASQRCLRFLQPVQDEPYLG